MPTKVIDVELTRMPLKWENWDAKYKKLYVVLRYKNIPVERLWIDRPANFLSEILLQTIVDMPQLLQRINGIELDERWENGTSSSLPQATIVICTRNRTDDLRQSLQAISQLPNDGQEILVVDNAPSNDDTWDLVREYGDAVRYVREDEPGLNNARNRALQEASHEIVAFNDDDACPEEPWLRNLLRNFAIDEEIIAVNGLTLPIELETNAQELFEQHTPFQRGFDRKIFDMTTLPPLYASQTGAGANMAVRRHLAKKVGLFNPCLDAGTMTQSGGDTDMLIKILSAGYRIVYEPSAVNWHRHRSTIKELNKQIHGYGVGSYAMMTNRLWHEKDVSMLTLAAQWFRYNQLPELRAIMDKNSQFRPATLLLLELAGCAMGPMAYFRSRARAENRGV